NDFVLFSQFLKLGGQVLAFNDSIQLDNTDINLDGSYGEISDFVMLHRSLTGNGPCSELFDSTSPNVATFTQSTDRARGNETFIDLTSIDSIGAI
ncbi:MAG: hypothetical protein ACRD5H_08610, partial [Nitrososphaerales archaeon]